MYFKSVVYIGKATGKMKLLNSTFSNSTELNKKLKSLKLIYFETTTG